MRREQDVGRRGRLRLFRGDDCLVPQVVRKGERLDELLQAFQGGAVAVAVDELDVCGDGGEELCDFFEARVDVFLDVFREVLVEFFDPAESKSSQRGLVESPKPFNHEFVYLCSVKMLEKSMSMVAVFVNHKRLNWS